MAGMVSLRGLTDCLVATVASELDAWARGTCTLDIPTATLLQTHLRGRVRPRRISAMIRWHLVQKRRPQVAVAQWKDNGAHVLTEPARNMEMACRRYLAKLRLTMSGGNTVEMIMDASRLGGTDCEVFVCWSPERAVAGYPPPQAAWH